jgi:putative two-component system response regulator
MSRPTSRILIVDDEPTGRAVLEALLFPYGYELAFAEDGYEALTLAATFIPDLILLDVMMPDMDGFAVCRRLRQDPDLFEIPIVMVTALDDQESRIQGIEAGADNFISKPFNRMELRALVQTITRLNRYRHLMEERAKVAAETKRMHDVLVHSYEATLEGWVRALDLRDKETEGHSQRVTAMTVTMAQELGIQGEEIEHIRRGALLHDVGKLGIPDSILHKPGPLTDEEWDIMRLHPVYAYAWLFPIDFLRPALDIPYAHHEKWDGTGYPRGLKGEEIPLSARIFALVDVWDALRSDRPYRLAWDVEKVRQHLRSLSGIHFDPRLVEGFLARQQQQESTTMVSVAMVA